MNARPTASAVGYSPPRRGPFPNSFVQTCSLLLPLWWIKMNIKALRWAALSGNTSLSVFILGIYIWGNIPPKILYPKKLVNCVRLFRLDSLLQVYRCSSEWKTTSLYCIVCIPLLSANACSGTCNDTSHRHTVMQRPSASKTVHWTVKIAPTMHQKSLFGDQKSKKNSGGGARPPPNPLTCPPN